MSDLDELNKIALPHKIHTLITSYEKEIEMVAGLLEDIGETDEKAKVIFEVMLREKSVFLEALKNL